MNPLDGVWAALIFSGGVFLGVSRSWKVAGVGWTLIVLALIGDTLTS